MVRTEGDIVRAAVYARISQDSARDGLGVSRQESECRSRCVERGWRVVDVYADNDVSAYSGAARPGYESLMADVTAGHIDVIVAWHPDRLHRRPIELEGFIETIERCGVGVETVMTGGVDLCSPSGRLHARMLGSIARYESEHRSERLRSKAIELARAGKVGGGGRRPFGYEADRRTIIDSEAELIREAASRVLDGQSLYAIAQDWTSRGRRTVTGAKWSTTAIKTFLTRARVAGLREHRGEVVANAEWQAILERETWERVRAILMAPSRAKGRPSRRYLLTGMLRCGSCGHPLVGAPRTPKRGGGKRGVYVYDRGNTQRAYGCVKANGGCGGVYVLGEAVEAFVVDLVLRRLRGPGLDRSRRRIVERSSDDSTLLATIAKAEEAIGELGREFALREIARPALIAAQEVHQTAIDDARSRLTKSSRSHALDTLNDVGEEWDGLGDDRQRAVLEAVLSHVVIAPAGGVRNRFDPKRVEPRWIV
jgi:site-specific DNA recombinase